MQITTTMRCVGVSGVAEYCGVTMQTVYQWLYRHGPDSSSENPMPEPAVCVSQGRRGKSDKDTATYGWVPSQLADVRVWYGRLKGWDDREAAHHWVEIDAQLKEKDDAARTR
jgi:hypothetical protein